MEKILGFILLVVFVMWLFKPEGDETASNTRCPGDGGSMLYKVFTPIGDDCGEETPAEKTASDADRERDAMHFDAVAFCQQSIRNVLNDPGSADFDSFYNWRMKEDSDTAWTVYPTLRAANSFGALIRTTFVCKIERTDNRWELLALEEI